MFSCLDDNGSGRGPVGRRLAALHGDRQGAVVLFCLAAILVLLLMSWVLLDAIFATHDKGEVQASADAGAYSQAAVQARSMNMLAFTNVAKRSVVGAHAVYESMTESYARWIDVRKTECLAEQTQCEQLRRNLDLYYTEQDGDYRAYRDNTDYYMADLRALDTYQTYLETITPWWGWSEAVVRAQRNGATLATTFPPPEGLGEEADGQLGETVAAEAGGARPEGADRRGGLPVETGTFWATMVDEGIDESSAFDWEHRANVGRHWMRSERGAANPSVVTMGATHLMDVGLARTYETLGEYGRPRRLKRYDDRREWMTDTSTIALAYRGGGNYFDEMRDKYEEIGEESERRAERDERPLYRPAGTWGMARAEISYQRGDRPDLWRSAWTARMRPMALPDEFQGLDYGLNTVYQAGLDHLLLSGRIHEAGPDAPEQLMQDLVYMEEVSRGMDSSTIEGVGR